MSASNAPSSAHGRLHRARLVYLVAPLVAAAALISGGYMALDEFADSVAATIQPIEGVPSVAAGATAPAAGSDVNAIAAQ